MSDLEISELESGGPRPPKLGPLEALPAGLQDLPSCSGSDFTMGETKAMSNAGQPYGLSDALIALYLTEETGLPCNTKDYEITPYEATDSVGAQVERRALRVTLEKNTSIKQQFHLLTFGSDAQRCNVVLEATDASPVHCKVYAQLNSGPDVWVIEDASANGTKYVDQESRLTGISKKVVHGRVAAYGLCRIQIGRYIFTLWAPSDKKEMTRRECWFQDLDPILVTEDLLREQLLGVAPDYRPIDIVGHGGMGNVFKYMELTTGLMIAVKEEEVKKQDADERIQKEIGYMQSLKHVSRTLCNPELFTEPMQPNLVQYIASSPATNAGVKKWHTAMPLYQGRVLDLLPLEITAIEEVMLQLFDGVNYMHGQGVLHKDIKPENILVKGKSRPDVVLADYGICASLKNRAELMGSAGTAGFAAPEVSRMIVQTRAVDIYALGATFFVILEPDRCKGQHATVSTLEAVMRRPPKVYGGLVQSMMAHDARERPSLKECFDIVKARQRDWKKRIPLAILPSSVFSASGPRRSQRIQKAMAQDPPIIDLTKFKARRPRLAPIAENKRPQNCPRQQQVPKSDFKLWAQMEKMPGRKVLIPPTAPTREPQVPAPVQKVDFSVAPPPISANPFAHPDRSPASNINPPARRQATPAIHEPPRTPIKKPDNDVKRSIRRGSERRKMVERWHKIRVQKNKICHAAGELASGTPLNVVRSLRDMTHGGFGITGQYLGLIFTDLTVAMPALHHIAPQTKRWGLNTNKRLMYGLKSQGLWPMTPEEYEAERLQSQLDFPNTTEGKRVQARLDAQAEYWRWERDRERAAEREMWRREQTRLGRMPQFVGRV